MKLIHALLYLLPVLLTGTITETMEWRNIFPRHKRPRIFLGSTPPRTNYEERTRRTEYRPEITISEEESVGHIGSSSSSITPANSINFTSSIGPRRSSRTTRATGPINSTTHNPINQPINLQIHLQINQLIDQSDTQSTPMTSQQNNPVSETDTAASSPILSECPVCREEDRNLYQFPCKCTYLICIVCIKALYNTTCYNHLADCRSCQCIRCKPTHVKCSGCRTEFTRTVLKDTIPGLTYIQRITQCNHRT